MPIGAAQARATKQQGEEAVSYRPPQRTAGGTPRVPVLDGFRAYAILGIVFLHLLGTSGVLSRANGTGEGVVLWSIFGNNIDAFFMISGFVLFLPTVVRGGEFGSKAAFWIARGARLLPAYWLVLALALLLVALVPPVAGYQFPSPGEITAHLTVTQMPVRLYDGDLRLGFGVDGPVWMISIVVSFYLLLPFVARSYCRHPLIGLAVAAAITLGWKEAIVRVPGPFEALSDGSVSAFTAHLIAIDQLPGWAFSFGLGMTGAWGYTWVRSRYSREQLVRVALLAAPFVLALYAYGVYLFGSITLIYDGRVGPVARAQAPEAMFASVFRAAVIAVVVLGPVWMQRPFVNRITGKLAELSYGIYLIHILLVAYAASQLDLPTDGTLAAFAVWTALIVPLSLVWAALSRRYVEQPVQRWLRARRWFQDLKEGGAGPSGPLQPEI